MEFLIKNYLNNVLERYKLSLEEVQTILEQDQEENYNIYEIMCLIGRKRGCIVSGGNIDDEKVANILLDDFRNCKIRKNYFRKGSGINGRGRSKSNIALNMGIYRR